MTIQVLGSGCSTCKKLHEITQKAVKELDLPDNVEYITDISKIVEMGIMTSPVLVIDKKPVLVGFSNDVARIKDLILQGKEMASKENECDCNNNCGCK